MSEKSYITLENNIMDSLIEQQAKLGYMKTTVRLYYPLDSLNNILRTNENADQMLAELESFSKTLKDKIGEIRISKNGDRFCIILPGEASEYVHNNANENAFIYKLVKLISQHGTTMDDMVALFKKTDPDCEVKYMDDQEFDMMIRFNSELDRYCYCFKDEGCHITYHRFLEEDYSDFSF